MGKGTDQIATWSDLYSIGYRVPTSYRSSKECITYQNLEDLGVSTYRPETTYNAALNKSYFNGNTTTGFTFTRDSGITTFEDELPSLAIIANTAGISDTYYTVLGTLGNLNTNENVELCIPDLRVYLTMISMRDTPTGTLHYRLAIKSQSSTVGMVVAASSWRTFRIMDVEIEPLRYYFDDPTIISISPGRTYYLVVEWYTDMSYTSRGTFVSFKINESFSRWDCYCPTKCVPWNRIKGYNKQSISDPEAVKIPILCYAEEHMSETCNSLTCTFYYQYKLSGASEFTKVSTGSTTLSTSSGVLSGSAQKTCSVLINPNISGNIAADCLYIEVGSISKAKHWKYKLEYDGSVPTSWTDSVNATSTRIMIDWSGSAYLGSYNNVIKQLTGIHLYISA